MPRRQDLQRILVIGAGPIVIGQACEFDYSGTQACKVLKDEGYRVILANSNPATIMTDPEFAHATYVEPLDVDILCRIIDREQPDAVLPTLGGQTALNLAMQLVERGAVATPGTPELMHRVAVIGAGTLDSLPHNGAVVTLLSVCGVSHKEGYLDIVMAAIVSALLALVAVIALGTLVGNF